MLAGFRYTHLFFLLILILNSGCHSVEFDTPMPLHTGAVTGFGPDVTGRYDVADSVLKDRKEYIYNAAYYGENPPALDSMSMFAVHMIIEKKRIYYRLTFYMYNKRENFDPPLNTDNFPVTGHQKSLAPIKYRKQGFWVYEKSFVDTIVDLSKKDKLRMYDKAYYVNHFLSAKCWEICRLKPGPAGKLSFEMTTLKDQGKLKAFIIKQGSWKALVHLSDEQFFSFVKQGGFRQKIKFKKNKE